MERFYKKKPELKDAVAKAPGYGIFTTYGVSFVIGGSGGAGRVHDNKTKHNTYMKVGGASAGLQLGAAQTEVLFVFKTAAAMNKFISRAGRPAVLPRLRRVPAVRRPAEAGAKPPGSDQADVYTLTKNGLRGGPRRGRLEVLEGQGPQLTSDPRDAADACGAATMRARPRRAQNSAMLSLRR